MRAYLLRVRAAYYRYQDSRYRHRYLGFTDSRTAIVDCRRHLWATVLGRRRA